MNYEMKEVKKITRYVDKKNAIEDICYAFKQLCGIEPKPEVALDEVRKKDERQRARTYLSCLMWTLHLGANPYDAKRDLNNSEIIKNLFQKYNLEINKITVEDCDVLWKMLKEI